MNPAEHYCRSMADERQTYWGHLPDQLFPDAFLYPAVDFSDQMYIILGGSEHPEEVAKRAIDAIIGSEHIGGYMRQSYLAYYRSEVVDACEAAMSYMIEAHIHPERCSRVTELMEPVMAKYREINNR